MSRDIYLLTSNFSVQESYATPIPMYNLGDDNKIRSKSVFFSILSKIHAQYTLRRLCIPMVKMLK